jgi:aminoglycoside phosphotransferase
MSLSETTWLAADAALPQRDALLDTAIVADRIGRLIRADSRVLIERCDRLRVNYQIGKSLRVLHRVDAGNATWTIAARAYRDGGGKRAYDEAREASPCADVRSVFFDPELNTVFWVFPNDRKIAGLAAVAGGKLSQDAGLPRTWHSTRLVAYAPEKSATLACLDEGDAVVAYAKVAAHDQANQETRYQALCASLEPNPWLRLPLTLDHLPQYRLLLIEAIVGRRMDDPASGNQAVPDAGRLGAALATFHSLRATDAPEFTRFAAGRLIEASRFVGRIRPDVTNAVDALVGELISQQPDASEATVCLHGDVHPKNAIVTDRGVALIDVEDLAVGTAAADVGSFLAALLYLRRGGQLTSATHEAVARAFLVGYRSIRPLPTPVSLRWHTAAALLIERIFRAITRARPLGLLHMPALVSDARALLARHQR